MGFGERRRARHVVAAALAVAVGTALAAAITPPAGSAQPPGDLLLDAGSSTLRIERSPFRMVIEDPAGHEQLATVAGREGPPVRVPGIDGPLPIEPVGAAGGYPALGFVVGSRPGLTFPVGFFSGNRLFGAEAGALVSVTSVAGARAVPGGLDLDLATDAPAAGNATLMVRTLSDGGVSLDLQPPPELPAVSTAFTLTSPAGEGLYGLGARPGAPRL